MPRELFPEINSTNIFVTTIFPGNTAEEIEKLITDPLEEELRGVKDLNEITSSSSEGISVINIEFDDDVTTELARQRTKDLVDNVIVKADWPIYNNAKVDPSIFEFDVAERYPTHMLPSFNIMSISSTTELYQSCPCVAKAVTAEALAVYVSISQLVACNCNGLVEPSVPS